MMSREDMKRDTLTPARQAEQNIKRLTVKFTYYEISYDSIEVFGRYGTREEAEAAYERQLAEGGPAWDACEIVEITIDGTPAPELLAVVELAQEAADEAIPGRKHSQGEGLSAMGRLREALRALDATGGGE